jgi:hypothetical protein
MPQDLTLSVYSNARSYHSDHTLKTHSLKFNMPAHGTNTENYESLGNWTEEKVNFDEEKSKTFLVYYKIK